MTNEYKGYPLFNDIKDDKLRNWNRINILYNIKETLGNVVAIRYAQQLDKVSRAALLHMHYYIDKTGYTNVRREIIRGMQ